MRRSDGTATIGGFLRWGPCPTFYVDDTTGDVSVQGYVTNPDGHGQGAPSHADASTRPGRPVTPEAFDALFDTFHHTVRCLETLPAYAVGGAEEERLTAFHEGRPRPLRTVLTDPWLARIARTSVAGKEWVRVRVVDEPLTPYQRYEMAGYRESQAVGEQVSVVRRSAAGVTGRDFWLFDADTPDGFAVLMHYDHEGHWEGAEGVAEPAVIAGLVAELDGAARAAMPLNAFLAAIGA